MTTKGKKEEPKKEEIQPVRRFKGEHKIFHDLFKLVESKYMKNIEFRPQRPPNYDHVTHCHFFHSHDSSGKQMKYSNSVGGHCHEIKTYLNEKGEIKAECGPPVIKVKSRIYNLAIPDKHIHKVEYKDSMEITARELNTEAAKAISYQDKPDFEYEKLPEEQRPPKAWERDIQSVSR